MTAAPARQTVGSMHPVPESGTSLSRWGLPAQAEETMAWTCYTLPYLHAISPPLCPSHSSSSSRSQFRYPLLRQGLWCPLGAPTAPSPSPAHSGPSVSGDGSMYSAGLGAPGDRGRPAVVAAQHRARHKGGSLEGERMNEHTDQALLESGFGGFSHSSHRQGESSWKEVHLLPSAPTLLPGGWFAAATGTDTGTTKGAAVMLSKGFLAPGGLCLSPSGLSTCLGGLQNSMPNTYTQRRGSPLRDTVGREQGAPPEQHSPDSRPPARLPAGGRLPPEMNGSFAPLHLRLLLPSR